jgi:hypothetical protein
VLKGLCLVALFAFLQIPAQVPGKVTPGHDAHANIDKSASAPNKPPARSAPIVNSLQSENPQRESQPKTPKAEQKNVAVTVPPINVQKDRWDYAYIAASVLIALATLILAITARIQAKAAKISAEALMNSERAWVIVDADGRTKPIEHIPGQPANVFNFFVWNTGKTPASVTFTRSEFKKIESLDDLPNIPKYRSGNLGTYSSNMLAPVGPKKMGSLNIIIQGPELDLVAFNALLTHQFFIYVHGEIEYADVFEKKRRTTFGFYWHVPLPGDLLSEQWVRYGPPNYNECT